MRFGYFILAVFAVAILAVSIFTTDRLTRFCLYTPLKVLVISLGLSALLWGLSGIIFENLFIDTYFDVRGKDLFWYPFFLCFCCSMASYSIFLCKLSFVRQSGFLTFCSFFLFPLLVSYLIVVPQFSVPQYILQYFYYSLAFVIPQTYFYITFRKKEY